jgi:membrane-associated phospholipid phosphatase
MDSGLPEPVVNRVAPWGRYGLRVTLLACAFVIVTVPFATVLYEVLAKGTLTHSDASVANWMNHWVYRYPALVKVLEIVSWFGLPLWLGIIVTAGAAYALWRGRKRLAAYLVVTVVGGSLVDTAVKLTVNRPRPIVDHPLGTAFGTSFPSGHTMASTLAYGAVLLAFLPVIPKRRRPIAVGATSAMVLAIGLSRLLLGLHFVTDVVGGFLLGLAWLLAATAVFEIWRQEEGVRPVDTTELAQKGVEPEAASALRGASAQRH